MPIDPKEEQSQTERFTTETKENTSVAVVLDFERLRANLNYTHEIGTMWNICILFRDREFRFRHMCVL